MTTASGRACVALVISCVVLAGCFSESPVGVRVVDAVRVTPGVVSMPIGSNASLHAAVLDEFGVAFAGVPLRWSSEDEAIAVVTQTGVVTGLGRGVAKVFVTASNIVGSSTVEVTGPPMINLSPTSVAFTGAINSQNPPPQVVAVTNSGEGSLGDLTLGGVNYGAGEPTGWLTAELRSQPLSITLRVVVAGMPVGDYSAVLSVEGGDASNAPVLLPVSLRVTQ